jgi:hypothetical protein
MEAEFFIDLVARKRSLSWYNDHLDEPIGLLIDGNWYVAKLHRVPDVEHRLRMSPITDGRLTIREDTGGCGPAAICTHTHLADHYLVSMGLLRTKEPTGTLNFEWDPDVGRDDATLYFGAFKDVETPVEKTDGNEDHGQ